jgi:hypothetical protein
MAQPSVTRQYEACPAKLEHSESEDGLLSHPIISRTIGTTLRP